MFGYPSWIAELRGKSPAGMELRRYAYDYLEPGEALVLVRERAEPGDRHAVSYRHREYRLGFPPARNIRPHADCRSPRWPLASTEAKVRGGEQLSHQEWR